MFVAVAVIAPAEGDAPLVQTDNPVVGNRNAVSIPPKIVYDFLRICKRRFAIDHPIYVVKAVEKLGMAIRAAKVSQPGPKQKILLADEVQQLSAKLS